MPENQKIALVTGYHKYSYPPPRAFDAGLTERFAVIFYSLDASHFCGILEAICRNISHDSLKLEMVDGEDFFFATLDELIGAYRQCIDDYDEPAGNVLLFLDGRLISNAAVEWWAIFGGPAPYHDSYTLSFYTHEHRAEEFRRICERLGDELGVAAIGHYDAAQSKEPYIPLWKRPLKWLGMKAW